MFNTHLKNKSLFISDCYNNEITCIKNLLTKKHGHIITFAELKKNNNIGETFLDSENVILVGLENILENRKNVQLQREIKVSNTWCPKCIPVIIKNYQTLPCSKKAEIQIALISWCATAD